MKVNLTLIYIGNRLKLVPKHEFSLKLDDSPKARLVGETSLRAQWCTSHRVTSHCAPLSRTCASTYEVHMPQCPPRASNGHPKHPNDLILAQSRTKVASI